MASIGDDSPRLSEQDMALGRRLETCPTCGETYVVSARKAFRCLACTPSVAGLYLECQHRGLSMRAVQCATCGGGKKRLTVLACSIYGECSLAVINGVRNCEACIRAGENRHPQGA